MKHPITLALIMAFAVAPTAVLAGGYHTESKVRHIQGSVVDSKQAAYEAGVAMMRNYRSKSSAELGDEFSYTFESVDHDSFTVTDTKVIVDEFLQTDGQMAFQPVLSVKYEFRKREIGSR